MERGDLVGLVALLFGALDLREVTHQLDEGSGPLFAVVTLAAVLRLGAGLAALRASGPVGAILWERHRLQ